VEIDRELVRSDSTPPIAAERLGPRLKVAEKPPTSGLLLCTTRWLQLGEKVGFVFGRLREDL